jgi:hypothetical protein
LTYLLVYRQQSASAFFGHSLGRHTLLSGIRRTAETSWIGVPLLYDGISQLFDRIAYWLSWASAAHRVKRAVLTAALAHPFQTCFCRFCVHMSLYLSFCFFFPLKPVYLGGYQCASLNQVA